MTTITVHEIEHAQPGQPNARVTFGDLPGEYPITICSPFSLEEEHELAWYFEDHLEMPYLDGKRFEQAAGLVDSYGVRLFQQVICGQAAARYYVARDKGVASLQFKITGSPEFHALHWEALRDPDLPRAFALEAPLVRLNPTPSPLDARVPPSPTLNILLITARPGGRDDVAYRTISRPLVEATRQAGLPVRIDILRPGTYAALVKHLNDTRDAHGGEGFYHILHFDVHGALLTYDQVREMAPSGALTYQTAFSSRAVAPYEGRKAYLLLDSAPRSASQAKAAPDLVEAAELAGLLKTHNIPAVVLNACQSGKEASGEASLAGQLMVAGVQVAVGMSYSVTVTAARALMTTLYQELFAGKEFAQALRSARAALFEDKQRKAYGGQSIPLEDWLLPVVYQNQPARFELRDFTLEESNAFYTQQAGAFPFPAPAYGFFGRDLDILEIEKRLLSPGGPNLLLVHGMGGAGKTTLLRHLGAWWQATGFAGDVFYFGYDAQPYTVQNLVHSMARALFTDYERAFTPLNPAAAQAKLCATLRGTRYLLILDNLESVTGAHLAIGARLPPEEQEQLKAFIARLAGGKTPVLIGSRGEEAWLARDIPALGVYDLGGLDREAASDLADTILRQIGAELYRAHPDFTHLLRLLDGYPLALEVVLPNLKRQTPTQVLEALQEGEKSIDPNAGTAAPPQVSKTQSILKCVEYAYSNLSEGAQSLLMCLAPFSGVVNQAWLEHYTEKLAAQPALESLPFDQWRAVLDEAIQWGLLSPVADHPDLLQIQPVLPYFLRARRGIAEDPARQAVESAFIAFYREIGGGLGDSLPSQDPRTRQNAQFLARVEYENLLSALDMALDRKEAIYDIYSALWHYLDSVQDHPTGLALAKNTLARLDAYPPERLASPTGANDLLVVLDDLASRQLSLKQLDEAAATYRKALAFLESLRGLDPTQIARSASGMYHQLGYIATEQRQWEQAEGYLREALRIKNEINEGYTQALTYHELGRAAMGQGQWTRAEEYYQKALEIKGEFNDRYGQAGTYQNLGAVAHQQGQWAQAERCYQEALAILNDFNDLPSQASIYHQLGILAQDQGQFARSEHYYQQALKIRVDFNDNYNQSKTYHQLGVVAGFQQRWAQAEAYFQQALQIKMEYQDRAGQAMVFHELGNLALAQQHWAEAERYYQQALDINQDSGNAYDELAVRINLGLAAQGLQQWSDAKAHFRRALEISVKFKASREQALILTYLARLLKAAPASLNVPGMVAEALGISAGEAEARLSGLLR